MLMGVRLDSARTTTLRLRDTVSLRLERNDASTSPVPAQTIVEIRRPTRGDTNTAVVIGRSGSAVGVTAQPLLIVDGVRMPQEALKRLAPEAIQSIEVIKGAAASKVYGPDGANGVIVVTTKGKK